jgi:hypothetical protein
VGLFLQTESNRLLNEAAHAAEKQLFIGKFQSRIVDIEKSWQLFRKQPTVSNEGEGKNQTPSW